MQTAPIPPFGGVVGDFGGARFRVSLVRRSPFQASFRPMPEPFLRVHPLCRNAIRATDASRPFIGLILKGSKGSV